MRSLVRTSIAVMLGLFLAIPLVSPAQAAATRDVFFGDAYGSYAFMGDSVVSGKTARSILACSTEPGTHVVNDTGASEQEEENTGGSMSTGAVSTSGDAIQNKSTTKTLLKSTTSAVKLLKGRITASRVRSSSATFTDGKKIETSSAGTVLADLVIDGEAFEIKPGPNTEVNLPNMGHVVLNEQFVNLKAPMPFLIVNGIHVYVTQPNALGIPVGTEYVISHAFSALKKSVTGTVGGLAYGHKLFEGRKAQSGPSALIYMSCVGTGGKPVHNTSLGAKHAPAFEVGNVKTTAIGKVTKTSARSELISAVESVNLLGGLITADEVRARARAARNGDSRSFTDQGSVFVNLVVNGKPIGNETGPNRQINLPGIGTLWLHRIIQKGNRIEVRMIELVVTEENRFNIKPGSKLQVAVAQAALLK